jgi:predicted ribosome quality control (RQC) complex YloA/Tae2 family protein
VDALLLAAVVRELGERTLHMRIERIVQPAEAELVLQLRGPAGKARVLCSADPRFARILLTDGRVEGPATPPPFCQVLRRHLEGGRIAGIEQLPPLERVAVLHVAARDELGSPARRRLVVELIPPQPNILLLDEAGRILDCLRRIPRRDAIPGRPYQAPAPQPGRIDPLGPDAQARLAAAWPGLSGTPAERLAAAVAGLSPRMARLALERGPDPAAALAALAAALRSGDLAPYVGGGSPSAICEASVGERLAAAQRERARQRVLQALRAHRTRLARKQERQAAELAEAEQADQHRRWGELLLARMPAIPPGATAVAVADLADPDRPVQVPIPPGARSPAAAAQAHFRRYAKAKRARALVQAQLAATRAEAAQLDDLMVAAETAEDTAQLEALADELVASGYLRAHPARRRPQRTGAVPAARAPRPLAFRTDDGLTVLVGTSALGNDELTLRTARPDDLWLHAKKMPGAHVILRLPPGLREPPARSLAQAAALAARYSAGRADLRVPVDYTRRRHVWKPRGARPGFVLYEHERTLMAEPDEGRKLSPFSSQEG